MSEVYIIKLAVIFTHFLFTYQLQAVSSNDISGITVIVG